MGTHLRRRAAVTAVLIAVAGACVWTGPIDRGDLYQASHQERTLRAWERRLATAVERADWVYRSPGFWALVAERQWLARADETNLLAGRDVKAALAHVRPAAQRFRFGLFAWGYVPFVKGGTTASTSSCEDPVAPRCGAIKVSYKHLGNPSYLVNTVAHEITHTVGSGDGACGCDARPSQEAAAASAWRFQDEGYSDATKVWLVSYAIGDLAQCYADHAGDLAATRACFTGNVNGNKCNRRVLECCGEASAALTALRDAAPQCRGYQCPSAGEVDCAYVDPSQLGVLVTGGSPPRGLDAD